MADETNEPEIVQERTRRVPTACAWCGTELTDTGKGRPRRYCSRSCRQREYELRSAQARYDRDLEAGAARDHDEPVAETVTRTVYVERSPLPHVQVTNMPDLRARAVQEHLEEVAKAVRDGRIAAHDHPRVWRGVQALLAALDDAHPGGIDALAGRRRR